MGLFSRKEKVSKEKTREDLLKKIEDIKSERGFLLKYYGGHPLLSRESQLFVSVRESNLIAEISLNITGSKRKTIFEVPIKEINKVSIEKEEEVIRRYTATRIALFGPFALAMKKKKVNKKDYLVIECSDFILTFDSNAELCKLIYSKITENRNSNSSTLDQSDSLDKIKKLKELLDMEAITQEEFNIKKKELLGI